MPLCNPSVIPDLVKIYIQRAASYEEQFRKLTSSDIWLFKDLWALSTFSFPWGHMPASHRGEGVHCPARRFEYTGFIKFGHKGTS